MIDSNENDHLLSWMIYHKLGTAVKMNCVYFPLIFVLSTAGKIELVYQGNELDAYPDIWKACNRKGSFWVLCDCQSTN